MERHRRYNPRRNYKLANSWRYVGDHEYRNTYGYSADSGRLAQAVFADYYFKKYKRNLSNMNVEDERFPYDFEDNGVRYEVKHRIGKYGRSIYTSGRQNEALLVAGKGKGKYIGVRLVGRDKYEIDEVDPELDYDE